MEKIKHPNFDAIKFAADLTHSFYECIKSRSTLEATSFYLDEKINKKIVDFVCDIEELIDNEVKKP